MGLGVQECRLQTLLHVNTYVYGQTQVHGKQDTAHSYPGELVTQGPQPAVHLPGIATQGKARGLMLAP